jgi:LAS superfamily LD-carboxypeptidase LdcB
MEIAGEDPITEEDNVIVTNAKPGSSLHNLRRAVDIVNYPPNASPQWENMEFFRAVWTYLHDIGWKWGGNFKKPDNDHFEK